MRKIVMICIFVLCLFIGCAIVKSAGQQEQLASVPPLISPESSSPNAPVMPPEPASDALAVSQATGEPPPSADLPPISAIQEQLDRIFADNKEFSGSVLIEKSGRVLLCRSYGMADSEKGLMNTPDTKFLVGSITKQFTAMAVMQLYEKGLLDIYDKLSDYIPDFTRGGDITLWNLLTQTSGITDYLNGDPSIVSSIPYEALSESALIKLIKTQPLIFEPGSKYSYSNTNYLLLGYIVEEISGLSYGDYLAQNIFEPLGMENTGVFDVSNPPENMATGYMKLGAPVQYFTADGDIIADSASFVTGSYGCGCLYSTVGDLYLWDQALSTEKLVSTRYINMMFNPTIPVPGAVPECAYGFGWVIDDDPDVGTIIRHTGILSGFRAYNGLLTDKDMTVIILYNIKEFNGRDMMIPNLKQALSAE